MTRILDAEKVAVVGAVRRFLGATFVRVGAETGVSAERSQGAGTNTGEFAAKTDMISDK